MHRIKNHIALVRRNGGRSKVSRALKSAFFTMFLSRRFSLSLFLLALRARDTQSTGNDIKEDRAAKHETGAYLPIVRCCMFLKADTKSEQREGKEQRVLREKEKNLSDLNKNYFEEMQTLTN